MPEKWGALRRKQLLCRLLGQILFVLIDDHPFPLEEGHGVEILPLERIYQYSSIINKNLKNLEHIPWSCS